MSGGFFAGSYGGDAGKITDQSRLECKICWYVYDPGQGDDYWQIPAGTAFSQLPDHWTCPNCDGAKSGFMVLDEEAEVRSAPEGSEVAEKLAAVFARIQVERMDGVPILNPRLEVEVIGVREWNGQWLALLVTPWFINLMLLPMTDEQATAWSALAVGSSVSHRFPAGRFDFIVGEEKDLGRYQMCSIFSPVLEFQDQAAARIAGRAALEALFDASLDEDRADAGTKAQAGEPETGAAPGEDQDDVGQSGISRRGLLRGKLTSGRGAAS